MLLLLGLMALAAKLYLLGSVIVHDPGDVVAEVILRNSDVEARATKLPVGLHFTTAKLEGEAVIRCRTGREISLGYITSTYHLKRRVRAADCAARTR